MTIQSGRRIGTIFLVFKKDPLSFILCVSSGRPYFSASADRSKKRIGVPPKKHSQKIKPKGRPPLKI